MSNRSRTKEVGSACAMLTRLCQIFIIVSLLVVSQTSWGVVLVQKGQPVANIVINKDARVLHRFAAGELQKYIKNISGAELPIVADGTEGNAPNHVYVGESAFTKELGIDTAKLPEEGLVIQAGKNYLALVGRDASDESMYQMAQREVQDLDRPADRCYMAKAGFGAYGEAMTLDAVYHFLEDFCGVRWYLPGPIGEVVPKSLTMSVEPTKVVKSPYYHYRNWQGVYYSDDPAAAVWARQIGFGASKNITANHSLWVYSSQFKEHPEWFALYDGKRNSEFFCLSSPELLEQVIKDARAYFDQHPEQASYIVMPPDSFVRMCDEPRCQAQIDKTMGPSGDFSNYVWGFVNKVAIAVTQTHPGKLISGVAYDRYTLPPKGIELAPNIYVRISKRVMQYYNPKFEAEDHRTIELWRKAQKDISIGIYEYYDDHAYQPNMRAVPQSIPHVIGADYNWLVRNGMNGGTFVEGGSEMWPPTARYVDPGMTHLNFYVTGKLLWDPYLNVETLLTEYYNKFYGTAAKPMRSFYELTEKSWIGTQKDHYDITVVWRDCFPPKTVKKMFDYLDQAKRLAGKGIYGERVAFIRDQYKELPVLSKGFVDNWPLKKCTVYKAATAPVIDGNPDDACWQHAERMKMIRHFDGTPAALPGYSSLAYDDTNLYFLGVFDEPEMDIQYVVTKTREGPLWDDSGVELFLDTKHDRTNYYQILANMNGVVGSYQRSPEHQYPFLDANWIPNIKPVIRKEPNRWIIEYAVPLKDLGISGPITGQTWGANVYRNRKTTNVWSFSAHTRYGSGWNATFYRNAHIPERFGILTFSGAEGK